MKKINTLQIGLIITFFIIVSIGCVEEEQQGAGNMKLSSPAFEYGGLIPIEYTCDEADVSPPLNFSGIPENAKSLAIIMVILMLLGEYGFIG
ncbi:MAG: hypothetical protein JSW60_08035 [Thermoplasmatales archaeon]|nr:MAG: hypothetical protein JSW60_08035 [Thermoplasmatales archaeon]